MTAAGAEPSPASPEATGAFRLARTASLVLAVALAAAAPLILLAGIGGYRIGTLSLAAADDGAQRLAMLAGLAGAGVALLALVLSLLRPPRRGAILAVIALTAALMAAGNIYGQRAGRAMLPPLSDVQTDWSRPVAFSEKALAVRESAGAARLRDDVVIGEEEGRWAGLTAAEAQSDAYPFLKTLLVAIPPPEATLAAVEIAKRRGWQVMLSDPTSGQIEAVDRSFWFGLPADIAVRVEPQGDGARIDVRAASRGEGPDRGANAGRIKGFLDDLAFSLRGSGAPLDTSAPSPLDLPAIDPAASAPDGGDAPD